MKDAQRVLNSVLPSNVCRFHGFDISSPEFAMTPDDFQFSIQDALKPFPAQHLRRYDIVHVGRLCAAIKEEAFGDLAAKLYTLLSKKHLKALNYFAIFVH